MKVFEWKKFNFCRLVPYSFEAKVKNCFKGRITACTSNSKYKIFCDESGFVHLIPRSGNPISFYATNSEMHLCCVSNSTFVVLTSADTKYGVILKAWNLEKVTRNLGTTVISSTHAATALNVHHQSGLCCVAVGFENGDIYLFRGSISREFSTGLRCFQACSWRIIGIEFKQRDYNNNVHMFVCSDYSVLCYLVTEGNDVRETKIVLDTRVEPSRCCALQTSNTFDAYFIVGRDDAIYCYTNDGKGPCFAIEGQKRELAWFGSYIVVAIRTTNSLMQLNKDVLVIIDIDHKMIVLNKPIDASSRILNDTETCFILSEANDIMTVCEKDVNTKLELLIEKNLYDIALRIVAQGDGDEKKLAEIHRVYGDYLYGEGDFSRAVEQYNKTIGVLEPDCIIRKFLDSKLVHSLAEYLEALQDTKHATKEQLQLLANCRTRINLPKKLSAFLSDLTTSNYSRRDLYCSMREILRANTGVKQSNDECQRSLISINLEEFLAVIKDTEQIKEFLKRYCEHQISDFFKEYGKSILSYHPQQVTEVLKLLCSDCCAECSNKSDRVTPETFIPIFVEEPTCCLNFLEHAVHVQPQCKEATYNFLLELHLRNSKDLEEDSAKILKFLEVNKNKYNNEHALIICKYYRFWDGVLFFCEHNSLLSWLIQYTRHKSTAQWHSSRFQISSLRENLNAANGNDVQTLHLIQNAMNMGESRVVNIKRVFTEEYNRYESDNAVQEQIISNLRKDVQHLKTLLNNYNTKPIVFRNNICDKCKQQLKYPIKYFLCRHAFHKHCASMYSDNENICIVCASDKSRSSGSAALKSTDIDSDSHDIITSISTCFKDGLYYGLRTDARSSEQLPVTFERSNPNDKSRTEPLAVYKRSNNPFEPSPSRNPFDQYDDNLNPFEN